MYWVKFFGKYLLSLLFMLVFVSTPAIIALISKNILLKIICFIISGTVFVFWIKWLMISSEKHAKDRKLGIYADDYDETRTFAYKLRKYSGLSKIKYNTFNFIFMLLNSLWVGLVLFGNPINFFPIEFIF